MSSSNASVGQESGWVQLGSTAHRGVGGGGANAVSKVKKGHAKCIPRQIYVKERLWHTSNSFLMKTLGKGTILFLAFLRSAQGR